MTTSYPFILPHKICKDIVESSSLFKARTAVINNGTTFSYDDIVELRDKLALYSKAEKHINLGSYINIDTDTITVAVDNMSEILDQILKFKNLPGIDALEGLRTKYLKTLPTQEKKDKFNQSIGEIEALISNGFLLSPPELKTDLEKILLNIKEVIDLPLPTWKKIVNSIYHAVRTFCDIVVSKISNLKETPKKESVSSKPKKTYRFFDSTFDIFNREFSEIIKTHSNLQEVFEPSTSSSAPMNHPQR